MYHTPPITVYGMEQPILVLFTLLNYNLSDLAGSSAKIKNW